MAEYKVKINGVEIEAISIEYEKSLSLEPERALIKTFLNNDYSRNDTVEIYRDNILDWKGYISFLKKNKSTQGFILELECDSLKRKLYDILFKNGTKLYFAYIDTDPSTIINDIISQAGYTVGEVDTYGSVYTLRFFYNFLADALKHVLEVTGWEFQVYPDDKAYFKSQIGDDLSSSMVFNTDNLILLEKEIDYTQIANKLYVLGRGVPDENKQLDIITVVEDATSQSNYGLIEKKIIDRRFVNTTSLTAYANTLLADLKEPKIFYRFKALPFINVSPGDTVKIIDDELNIDENVRVLKIKRKISSSGEELELSIAKLIKQSNLDKYKKFFGIVKEMKKIISATEYAQGDKISINFSYSQNCSSSIPMRFRFFIHDLVYALKDVYLWVYSYPARGYTDISASDIRVGSYYGVSTDDLWRNKIIQHKHKTSATLQETDYNPTQVEIKIYDPGNSLIFDYSYSLPVEKLDLTSYITQAGVYRVEIYPDKNCFLESLLSGIEYLEPM